MARFKIPNLQEIYDNPALIEQLPGPIAEKIVAYFQRIEQLTIGAPIGPASPVEMAIRHPRWKWMDTRHLHYVGDRVAETVNSNGASIVCLPPQHGKQLAHDTPVLTPGGWRRHGDLRVGDYVFGGDGKPTKVVGLSEESLSTLEIEFTDGEKIKCHQNHEWVVWDRAGHGGRRSIRTLEAKYIASQKYWSGNRARFQVETVPVEGQHNDKLPIDPYILGAWLGDGTTGHPRLTHAERDTAVALKIAETYPVSAVWRHKTTGVLTSSFAYRKPGGPATKPSRMKVALRRAGVLNDKHIPDIYLTASKDQRLQLLAGLIDTDGYVHHRTRRACFSSVNTKLAKSVASLVRSLGMRATVAKFQPAEGSLGKRPFYQVTFSPHLPIPCQLERKRVSGFKIQRRLRGIKSIRKCRPVPGRCIQVSARDGIYLAGRTLIPTHNSHTCSVWTPFWKLVKQPESNTLIISSGENFARKWSSKVRDLVNTYGAEYNLAVDPKHSAAGEWQITAGGSVAGVGVNGVISGRYLNLIIIDDAIKDFAESHSEASRSALWEWWEGTVIQRIQPDTAVIVVNTRYREDDFCGRLIEQSNSGTGIKFDLCVLPAMAEDDDPLGRSLDEGLWLGPNGKGQDFYEKKRSLSSPYVWASQFQQMPSPPGGNLVDPEWWQFYRDSDLPSVFNQEIQSWDLALDGTKKADSYFCGGVLSRHSAMVYVREAFHEHCGILQVVDQIKAWKRYYPGAKQKLIERSLAGPALAQMLQHEVSGMLPWPPKGRQKGSKEACLDAIIPDIRSGNVRLPILPNGAKPRWVVELIEELRQFPRSAHDDYVDMISQGVSFLLPSARRDEKQHQRDLEAARANLPKTPEQEHTARLHSFIKKNGAAHMARIKEELEMNDSVIAPLGARVSTSFDPTQDEDSDLPNFHGMC